LLLCAQCADRVHASTGGKSMPKQPNVLPDSRVGLLCFERKGKMEHANTAQGHILLVEDVPSTRENLARILEKTGFTVTVASDGEQALELLKATKFDLVLLDIELPILDGLSVLIEMRRDEDLTPVILLTKFSDVAHRIVGLRLGADDYIGKPFSGDEVVERIKAVLRRTFRGERSLASYPRLKSGLLRLDRLARCAYLHDQKLNLSQKEVGLLECLMLHPCVVLTRKRILENLSVEWIDDPRIIDHYLSLLRGHLGDDPKSPTFIETVHSVGYHFIGPVEGEE
jgi:DNA-binding response OmpR family regulator